MFNKKHTTRSKRAAELQAHEQKMQNLLDGSVTVSKSKLGVFLITGRFAGKVFIQHSMKELRATQYARELVDLISSGKVI